MFHLISRYQGSSVFILLSFCLTSLLIGSIFRMVSILSNLLIFMIQHVIYLGECSCELEKCALLFCWIEHSIYVNLIQFISYVMYNYAISYAIYNIVQLCHWFSSCWVFNYWKREVLNSPSIFWICLFLSVLMDFSLFHLDSCWVHKHLGYLCLLE